MTLRMLGVTVVAILGAGSPAAQDVYQYIDEAGRPVFTDQPPPGREAERLDLPSPAVAGDADRRLERINETATMLKEDRMARESRRDALRRESARRAHEAEMAKAAEEAAAREPRVVSGGWHPAWTPGYGRWPGWHPGLRPPGHRPGHPPAWRPPYRPELRPSPGGVLRPGPGATGW